MSIVKSRLKNSEDYVSELKRRAAESHVYRNYQLTGLQIAEILGDEKHKALYIKLVKEHGADRLLQVAKEVADRKNIKSPGAYFMKIITAPKDKKN